MANVKGFKDVQEENDDEKRQAYYAGGQGQNGGGSGQEVLDPRDIFKRAEENGAQTVDQWNANGGGQGSSSAFTGAGQSLNGDTSEGAPVPVPTEEHTITFYSNGFVVDDGPLRTAEDPANASFLAAINRGQMPAELVGENGASESDVHIIDKSGEPYKPPPAKLKPFTGEGRSMREEAAASGAGSSSDAADVGDGQPLELNADAPSTTLQLVLPDGKRLVIKANKSHTVLQLRQHIASLGYKQVQFKAGFPPKIIDRGDDGLTLEDAKLCGESIRVTT